MPAIHYCPYWKWEEKQKTHCEIAVLKYPEHKLQASYCKKYCANETGWKDCSLAQELNKYYEGQA